MYVQYVCMSMGDIVLLSTKGGRGRFYTTCREVTGLQLGVPPIFATNTVTVALLINKCVVTFNE